MKKAICIAATAILVFSLAGCGETAGTVTLKSGSAPVVNEGISQEATAAQETAATLFSDSKDMTTVPETEKPAKMEAEAPVDDPSVSTEAPTETAKPQEEAEVQHTTAETPQPEEPASQIYGTNGAKAQRTAHSPRNTAPGNVRAYSDAGTRAGAATCGNPAACTNRTACSRAGRAGVQYRLLDRLCARLRRKRGAESGQHCHRLLGQSHRCRSALHLPGTGHSKPLESLRKG